MIRFKSSADKHNVPRGSSRFVALVSIGKPTVTNRGQNGVEYIGIDDRGIELEVITVQEGAHEVIIHAMPTSFRFERSPEK